MTTNLLARRPRMGMGTERFPTNPGAFPRPPSLAMEGGLPRSKSTMEPTKPNYRCLTYVLRIPNSSRPTTARPHSRHGGHGNEPRERMQDAEKRVLKRRKGHLAEHIQVTDAMLEQMIKSELLTPEMVKIVDDERTNLGKVSRLIDLLLAVNDDRTFSTLCELLSSDYLWLVRDLQAEIRMEKGDVEPSADTLQEADMLVHRKFGHNKRLSQTDKREFVELMAAKLQISREEWERQMAKLKSDYASEKQKNDALESKSRLMAKQLSDFYRKHESQLNWHSHDMTTTSKALQILSEDSQKDAVTKLYEVLVKFYEKVAKMLHHRESLMEERVKCLLMFKVPNEEVSLDHAIRTALQMKDEGSQPPVDKDHQRTIKRLNKKISDLETEIDKLEETIANQQEKSKAKNNKIKSSKP